MKWSLWMSVYPLISCPFGMVLNALIIAVYYRDYTQGNPLTVCDQILSSMTLSSLALQWTLCITSIIYYVEVAVLIPGGSHMNTAYDRFNFFMIFFLSEVSFWQTALLSTYYSLKLLSFSHRFFSWLKMTMLTCTMRLVMVAAAVSFLINIPFVWTLRLDNSYNLTADMTGTTYTFSLQSVHVFLNMTLGSCLPCLVTFICISLSVRAILHHVCRIGQNGLQVGSARLGGLVWAACTMSLCVFCDLSFSVIVIGTLLSSFTMDNVLHDISWAILTSYGTVRSIILITGNPKLRYGVFRRNVHP
ncbi:taste receptor type 2 member 40-like [Anomaloglossus baeobatrachus]|uniref:taste receptor type 2 member 40-like n=1 Tax=Anomaloglossus baeobatrachus TaxID=238106 RepID=UPI003F501466